MSETFNSLLQRYLDNTATQEEERELVRMIHAGQYDADLKGSIDESVWEALVKIHAPDTVRENRIFEQVLGDIDAAEKVVPLHGKHMLRRVLSAAAVLLITVMAGLWYFTSREEKASTKTSSNSVLLSGKQLVQLADGSTVLLNEGSEIRHDDTYGQQTREVFLTGEAYFDVTPDAQRPFIVHTGEVSTKVLGTAFNINAYPGQDHVTVTVARGKVEVTDNKRVTEQLMPDEQLSFNTKSHEYAKTEVNAEKAIAWKSSFLILDRVTMEEAAARMEKHFNTNVIVENKALNACLISVSFLKGEDRNEVAKIVSTIMQADYKIKGDTIIIAGGSCN
ncbi:MAG TPA: FecR domain-containing protein [Chryseolinea sp.]|nr:FecR domain-containing protein [Chryseolinea sp.]